MATFRGFEGFGSGGADRRRDQGARRGPVDQRGEGLRDTIRNLLGDSRDREVQEALRHSYHALPDDQRPSGAMIVDQVAQLVDLATISPQQAILRMAGAGWDYAAAVATWLAEEDGSSSPLSSPRGSERGGDPKEVQGLEEGGDDDSDDDMEEGEESSEEERDAARFRQNLALNPGIDREPAVKGDPVDSKLTIRIIRPGRKPDFVRKYSRKVNWGKSVGSLNRWRAQIYRRNFGGTRPYRQHFHQLEKDWLLQEHLDFEQKRRAQGKLVEYSAMNWGEITERFNRRFENQHLPGVKTPRPARTKVALRTERSRVRAITDHTGLPFREHPSREGSKRRPSLSAKKVESEDLESLEEQEDGSSEESGGKGVEDPRSTRRGDPPPGKKPWRKDEDDEGRSGEGMSRRIRVAEISL